MKEDEASNSLLLDTAALTNLKAQGTALTLAYDKIEALEAELADLKPWAEIGKRALLEEWWANYGETPDGLDLPALYAQLEKT